MLKGFFVNAFPNKLKTFSFALLCCCALPHMQVLSLESLQECCTKRSGFPEASQSVAVSAVDMVSLVGGNRRKTLTN